jgi:adenylate kinase family enzyme
MTSSEQKPPSIFSTRHAMPIAVFVTGPPGSGKTTQVELVRQRFGTEYTVESFVGKRLREDARKMGVSDQILKQYKESNDSRLPLAEHLHFKRDLLGSCHYLEQKVDYLIQTGNTPIIWMYSRGPSSAEQAKYLHSVLGIKPDLFLVLELEQQEKLIDRVQSRRVDPVTNITYNIRDDPPLDAEILSRLEIRKSDANARLEKRYLNWKQRTMPVIEYYKSLDINIEFIKADRSREQVFADVEAHIGRTLLKKQLSIATEGPFYPLWEDDCSSASLSPVSDEENLMDTMQNIGNQFVAVKSQ